MQVVLGIGCDQPPPLPPRPLPPLSLSPRLRASVLSLAVEACYDAHQAAFAAIAERQGQRTFEDMLQDLLRGATNPSAAGQPGLGQQFARRRAISFSM